MSTATNPMVEREQWLEARRSYVGGSDLVHAADREPYGCLLRFVKDKRGDVPTGGEFFGNKATERGNFLEEKAAEWFALKTNLTIRKVHTPKAHKDFAFMRPQPDYEIVGCDKDLLDAGGVPVNPDRGPGLLSIKVPGAQIFRDVRDNGPDAGYILQLQYELAVWGREWGAFEFFCVLNDRIQSLEFFVRYDPELGKIAMDAAQTAWGIKENGPFPAKKEPEYKGCQRCPYKLDCHGEDLLRLMAAEQVGEVPIKPEVDVFITEIKSLEALQKEAEELVENKKDELKQFLGDLTAAKGSLYRVTYDGRSKDTFQADPFFKAHPELADERTKYSKKSAWRELRKYEIKEKAGK